MSRLASLAALVPALFLLHSSAGAQSLQIGPITVAIGDPEARVISRLSKRYKIESETDEAEVRGYSVLKAGDAGGFDTRLALLFFERERLTEVKAGVTGKPEDIWSDFLDAIATVGNGTNPTLYVEREEAPTGEFAAIDRALIVVFPHIRLEMHMNHPLRLPDFWAAYLDKTWSIDTSRPYDLQNLKPKATK